MSYSEIISVIMSLIGGLGLFLIGMQFMSEGLQKSAGNSLKKILEKLTSNRLIGTGVGAIVTTIIQSSSATTVMVVGFVNAGLISLTQALSIILGANIGTTITAQIIAFKVSVVALPAVGLGAILFIFFKKPFIQYIGQIMFGFGMLFLGMEIMTDSFSPLAKSENFKQVFVTFSTNPILAVFAGAVTTLVVQSSSATMGITIALATTGIIDFPAAAALVLGENIGTTITANIAALNASKTAKQAALGHFLFNLIGVTYMVILLHPFMNFINAITLVGDVNEVVMKGSEQYYPNIARHIANLHTMFNIINTAVFLPFLPLLAKLCEKIIKDDKEDTNKNSLAHVSEAMLSTPEIAVGVVKEELIRMYYNATEVFNLSKKVVIDNNRESAIKAKETAKQVYKMSAEINAFIQKLSTKPLSLSSLTTVHNISMAIDEVRQFAERSYKLVKAKNKIIEKNIVFSPEANTELNNTFDLVDKFVNHFTNSFIVEKENNLSELNFEEDTIDSIRKEVKKNHLNRLEKGVCSLQAGLSFMDIINNLEKIADNLYLIAQIIVDNKN